jgi:hypothetical protein
MFRRYTVVVRIHASVDLCEILIQCHFVSDETGAFTFDEIDCSGCTTQQHFNHIISLKPFP